MLNVQRHRSYKDYNDEYRSRRNVLPYLPRHRLGDGRNLCPWVSLHALRRIGLGIRLDSRIPGGKCDRFILPLLYRFSEELRVLTSGVRAFTAFGRDVTVLVALLTAELLVSFWAKPGRAALPKIYAVCYGWLRAFRAFGQVTDFLGKSHFWEEKGGFRTPLF